jgi:hypothetical protein
MTARQQTPDNRRGFVLVSVLWLGAFLIVLIGALLQQSRTTLFVSRTGVEEAVADGLLTAAVESIAVRYMGSSPPKTSDGRVLTLPFANGSVRIAVEDANGLVDLNRAPPEMIEFFTMAGGDERSARAILERRGDLGAPLTAPWRTPGELADDRGISGQVAAFATSYATVFSTSGAINPMTAPLAVLLMLPGVDAETAAHVMAIRSGAAGDPQPVMDLLANSAHLLDPTPGKVYEAYLSATVKGGLTKTALATMLFGGDTSVPYRILDWRPWADQPAWVRGGVALQQ